MGEDENKVEGEVVEETAAPEVEATADEAVATTEDEVVADEATPEEVESDNDGADNGSEEVI